MMKCTASLLLFACVLNGKEFPVAGQTFPISEENLLDRIQLHAKHFDLKSYEKTFFEQMAYPPAVPGIEHAKEYRSVQFDPTIEFAEDIRLKDRTLLMKKGTSVNPLDTIDIPGGLLFFDGDDPGQVEWAKKRPADDQLILVKGSPLALQAEIKRPVFFDVYGALTRRFKIERVPAIVVQEGKFLRIEEIPVDQTGRAR